jgi:NRPS condensation-like uncharacterized protein
MTTLKKILLWFTLERCILILLAYLCIILTASQFKSCSDTDSMQSQKDAIKDSIKVHDISIAVRGEQEKQTINDIQQNHNKVKQKKDEINKTPIDSNRVRGVMEYYRNYKSGNKTP